ncbi:shikimate kinase [candidate division KSB1 bacterium]|nr:shikimate kinase [candidate division KSB1 bacterium]
MSILELHNLPIFLTGFIGSGKSTIGPRLAQELGLQFYDLDVIIETSLNKPILQIFNEEGPAFFRELEHQILKDVIQRRFSVIALGAGTIIFEENLKLLKSQGLLICFESEPETLWDRIRATDRRYFVLPDHPAASPDSTEPLMPQRIETLLKQRQPFYDQSDIFIHTSDKTIDEIIAEILSQIQIFKLTH